MKSTLSEAQIRGLLDMCVEESADAVRVTPLERSGTSKEGPFVPIKFEPGQDHMKATDLSVDVYGVPGGWTEGYHLRASGRWAHPDSQMWHDPAQAV